MRGEHRIKIYNNRVSFDFTLKRNITLLTGDSATGKTTICNLLSDYESNRQYGSVKLISDVPVYHITASESGNLLLEKHIDDACIFVIDENVKYVNTEYFAGLVKGSNAYFLIISRKELHMLPISINEVYKISSHKNEDSDVVYHTFENVYNYDAGSIKPNLILTEDSNSGYDFFSSLCVCQGCGGRDNVYKKIMEYSDTDLIAVVDGAACGAQFSRISEAVALHAGKCQVFVPESFEWLILKANLFEDKESLDILENVSEHVDSAQYESWERYFLHLLSEVATTNYKNYNKSRLNSWFLEDRQMKKIKDMIPSNFEL